MVDEYSVAVNDATIEVTVVGDTVNTTPETGTLIYNGDGDGVYGGGGNGSNSYWTGNTAYNDSPEIVTVTVTVTKGSESTTETETINY